MTIVPDPHEFLVWYSGAPVVCINVDLEYEVWAPQGYPVEEIDETFTPPRRRADIF
jgi:hypothetical protein